MLWFLLILLGVGLLIGAIARLLVPGPDPMGLLGTWLLGVLGSLAGGFLGYVLLGSDLEDGPVQAAGFLGSIVGAVLLLLAYRGLNRSRNHTYS